MPSLPSTQPHVLRLKLGTYLDANHQLLVIESSNHLEDLEALDATKHPVKDHSTYHICLVGDNLLEFL